MVSHRLRLPWVDDRLIVIGLAVIVMIATMMHGASAVAMSVTDDWGRTLRVDAPARRIVSLAPHATELLVAVGALDRLVGVDPNSDHPIAVQKLARVAAYPAPDIEALVALKPDWVVIWGAGARAADVRRLERLGISVFVSNPRRISDVASTLERFSFAEDRPGAAREASQQFLQTLSELQRRHQQAPGVPVFVQLSSRPLITLTDRDPIGDALRVCGANNIFAEAPGVAPMVDVEAVLARAPALIVSIDGSNASEPWRKLGLLEPAGLLQMVHLDPSVQRPGPRLLTQVARLCDVVDAVRKRGGLPVSGRTLR